MCGLWGYSGAGLDDAGLDHLTACAIRAEERGPDAWGMAYRSHGRIVIHRQQGRVTEALSLVRGLLSRPSPAAHQVAIGLCRLPTSGSAEILLNNQPVMSHGCVVVHNGNLYGWRDLFASFDEQPTTECDSEALAFALFVAGSVGKRGADQGRHALTLARTFGPHAPLAALALVPDGLLVMVDGHPVWSDLQRNTLYFCSKRVGESSRRLPDRRVYLVQEGVIVDDERL